MNGCLIPFSPTYRGLGLHFQRWGDDYKCPGWRIRLDLWRWRYEFGTAKWGYEE